jgi:GxxExxY protein
MLIEEELTHSVIGAFYEVYNILGFGFLEHLYVMALERELRDRGHHVAREVAVRVLYKGAELGTQRIDMIVDHRLLIETKSTPELHQGASRQVYNYLRATDLEVGLLLHFGPRPKFYRTIFHHNMRAAAGPEPLSAVDPPDSSNSSGTRDEEGTAGLIRSNRRNPEHP